MANYKVTITRTEYAAKTFEVIADTEEEAEELALSEAYSTYWDRGNADYEIEEIEKDENHQTKNQNPHHP